MQTPTLSFEQRYICYIDILGFKDAIENPDHPDLIRSPEYIFTALNIMKAITEQPDFSLEGLCSSQFSDCIAFSCHSGEANLGMMFKRIAHLQRELLKGGLLTRGGIAKGELFHQHGHFFGKALNEAVELEKEAKWPRVLLSDAVYADINGTGEYSYLVSQDIDDRFYVKYLDLLGSADPQQQQDLCFIRRFIRHGLGNNNNIRQKYEWLEKNIPSLKTAISQQSHLT
jgi:hypothetical protein